ncbi:Acyl transferase/acyl hydrolase/lysophospholipase, partial [Tolypocladium capitatum]
EPRAGLRYDFPVLPERHDEAVPGDVPRLEGLLDLESLPVIAGFGEVSSVGSSRTRWELEAHGEFSIEGCVELAWMTGLIRYERRRVRDGADAGAGWVECETGAPIADADVKRRLEGRLRAHTGIRLLDADASSNADPRLRDMLHEVGAEEDLPPFECSPQAAEAFRARHGSAVEVLGRSGDGAAATVRVRVRRGASIFVPKAINTDYFVGAQVPTGWDAARYGIPPEVLTQADRPALYALVCTVEAFLAAGLTDVYELYRYLHVSDVGNCLGSGAGGASAIQVFHEQRLLGREIRSDVLSEAFVGTASAWVNLLLLSASGPLRSGAGACASSLESLDNACDLIASGRAKFCLAGGYDVFTRPIYYEFGEMSALINSARDARCGREPAEMSRPFTTTRGGFVLSEGVGIQVVTTAALALEMGLPVYGVVALTHMAADKAGRSIPAPGGGILTAASQTDAGAAASSCLLANPALRARRIRASLGHVDRQCEADIDAIKMEADWIEARGPGRGPAAAETEAQIEGIRQAARREKQAVLRALGHDFWRNNPHISPISGALSVFGLTVQDISFASMHGTATRLNDLNECATLDRQMRHLGRDPGNPLLTIAQKSVVGHGVGASGAWAVNGALQAMHSGIIPGNRNADDIDPHLAGFDHLLLANENIVVRPDDIKAFSVTSFGFGQKGAQVIVVHPRYLYAAVSEPEYCAYRAKQISRARIASRELDRGLHGEGMFKAKEAPPYVGDEHAFLLNPLARTG